jgi:hypothetical protein
MINFIHINRSDITPDTQMLLDTCDIQSVKIVGHTLVEIASGTDSHVVYVIKE